MKLKEINIKSFCHSFRCRLEQLPEGIAEKMESINTNYRLPTKSELERYILDVLKKINSSEIYRNRHENLIAWEKGWIENLEAFQNDFSEKHLKPKYFRPSPYFRYNKTIVVPENKEIEFDLFTVVREYLFKKYFAKYNSIYELGCGSGQNIMLLSQLFPNKKIIGLDWSKASIKIANLIGNTFNKNVKGFLFDMMNPSPEPGIGNHSVIFSIHSLEQLGKNHSQLLSFLLRQNPALVLHYEPILELYDEKNLYDFLAIMYSKKRDYLSGYLTALRKTAQAGRIEMITEHRPYIGGIFHEASLITWRPLLKNGVRNDQR